MTADNAGQSLFSHREGISEKYHKAEMFQPIAIYGFFFKKIVVSTWETELSFLYSGQDSD